MSSGGGVQTTGVAPKCGGDASEGAKKCNAAPQKQQQPVEGAQKGGVRAENSGCKCTPNCTCNPCNCK